MNPAFPLNLSVHLAPVWSPWVTLSQNTTWWNRTTVFCIVGNVLRKTKTSCGAEPVRRFPSTHPDTPPAHSDPVTTPPHFVTIHLTSRGHLPINCNYYIIVYAAAHLQHRSVHCSSTCLEFMEVYRCLSWSPEDEPFGLKDVLPVGGADCHIFTLVSTVWRFLSFIF